jgi:superfamily II DNA or RNA helicase
VLDALADVGDVQLDGAAIELGPPTTGLCVRVVEAEGSLFARLEQESVDRVLDNGAIVRDGRLMALQDPGLSDADYGELRRGRRFGAGEVATLVGDLLPRWRRHLPVHVDADLPTARTARPRIHIAAERDGDLFAVLPTIVYGDPAIARLDGDRLTALGGDQVPLRNERLERGLLARLHELGLEPGVRAHRSADEAIELVGRADDSIIEPATRRTLALRGGLAPRLEIDADGEYALWFEVEGAGADESPATRGTARADAGAVLRAWQRGDAHAPLLEGGFGRIPADFLARHGDRLAALLAARDDARGEARPWLLPDLAALAAALDAPPPPGFDRLRTLVGGFESIVPVAPPADVRATLRDYQLAGISWLAFLRDAGLGALLADDMGLGKTLQTLCAIRGRTLVVAPTSVVHNWAAEIARFRPGLRVATYHGADRSLDPAADVVLTTYAILRLDVDALAERGWDTVVLDEAQSIKNPDSQVARAAYRLRADFRVALTGTPVENRLDDLWSQMHFLDRGLLGGRNDFHERWVRPIADGDAAAAARLRERIRPFVLRRLKRDVARELPPRTDVVLRCDLRDDERAAYDTVRAATRSDVLERLGSGASTLAVLEALLRLRQAACHGALLPGQATDAPRPSSKLELLLERLDVALAAGHKALVFSQWTGLLDLVEPVLAGAAIDFVRLDGSTRDRAGVVARFSADDGPPVMLVSLRAGGTGLNLTAADHVYLLDPWWNPAVEDQAADRAHRIGQDKPVLVHRLVARDTVEERILALQERKRGLADAALGEAGQALELTRDDLLALLG